MSLYQSSVKRPIMTALVYVAIAIIGVFSLSKLAIDLFPDMGENNILVFTTYTGASASDIENNVSRPLENTLNSVSNLKHISSTSKENFSIVSLEFEYGVDINEATNDVRDKLDMASSFLPEDASTPFIFKFSMEDIPILMLGVQSEESTNALYKILDDKVASPLSRIAGVGTVSIAGAPEREIQIYCDPYKLESYNLTIEGIAATIGAENRNVPLGSMDIGSETYSMRVQGEFADVSDLENIVVGSYDHQNVFLKDVATVKDTLQERMQEAFNNGKRGAMIIVQKQNGANSVKVAKEVYRQLETIKPNLPSDIEISVINDTTESIINTIGNLKDTILIILVLVTLVVMFFLGRWRATFIIILVIPVSLVAAFIYLFATGNSLNIISLSSLSIAIGMVVDDAIVVLENISKHIERGSKPKPAAIFATSEVSLSVIATTLVLLAVFLPLTMLGGMAGILFKQLGWIVSIVMVVSTTAALSLTPMLSSLLLKNNPNRGKVFGALYAPIEKGLDKLDIIYSKMLKWSLNHRKTIIFTALFIFLISLSLMRFIPTEFMPTQDNAHISMTIKLPIGTNLTTSKSFGLALSDRILKEYPEVIRCNFRVGQPDDDNAFGMMNENGNHVLSFNIRLTKKSERKKSLDQISDEIRKMMRDYSEVRTYTVSSGGGMGGNKVDIEIYGYDFDASDKMAAELAERMSKVPGCPEVSISRDEYTPEIQIDFDREKLAENGLNLTSAATYVRNRFNGYTASYYREEGDEYKIKVRYAPEFRESIEAIENILVYNSQGTGIRIRDLGNVVERMTPPTINRKDRERINTVSCIVGADAALSDIVAAAQKELNDMDIPVGMEYRIGGAYENQQESFGDILTLMVLIVLLVYIVMASQFESFLYPFVIMFSIPFALTGVFIGLYLTNTSLGILAMVGILMLIGIVVKNGIVLIDYTILCRERGMEIYDAVITAGRSRLRPILMTTLTTVLGMIPMAIGKGEGAEMWNSMGMTVAWGLSFSTLITLILIPTLYSIFADRKQKRANRKMKRLQAHKAALNTTIE